MNRPVTLPRRSACSATLAVTDTTAEKKYADWTELEAELIEVEWFDHWLKGEKNGALKRPKVRYYQMGANAWVTGDRFPLDGTEYVDLYLDSSGRANTLYGDGVLRDTAAETATSDGYIYDPLRPVQTSGGGACCIGRDEPVTRSARFRVWPAN